MKKVLFAAVLFTTVSAAHAQQNATGTAQQSVQLALSNAIEITFTNNNSTTGNTVNLAFNNADDLANGVESGEQELKIRSNKAFKVGVKIDYNTVTYSGNGNLNNAIAPANIFQLKVTTNTTGGTIPTPFSTTSYGNVTSSDQNLIINGTNGGNQKFGVKYKCTPGFYMPAGTYNFDVVYTATQQ